MATTNMSSMALMAFAKVCRANALAEDKLFDFIREVEAENKALCAMCADDHMVMTASRVVKTAYDAGLKIPATLRKMYPESVMQKG